MYIKRKEYVVRQLVESDASSLFDNYKSNLDSAKYISSNPHTDLEQTRQLIIKCLTNYKTAKPSLLIFAIAEPNIGEVIGLLVFVFNEKYAEIHLGLAREFCGRGIATSVCLDGVTWLKGRGVKGIRTHPYYKHHASLRVLEKCGFKNHGLLSNFAKFPQLGHGMKNCVDMRINFK